MENKSNELSILLKTAARVEVMEERFDRHMGQITDMIKETMQKVEHKFDQTDKKIDDLAEKLTTARIDTIEKHGSLKAKMAGLSAGVAIITHFLSSFIHDIIKK